MVSQVARIYAQALYEIAKETKQIEAWSLFFQSFQQASQCLPVSDPLLATSFWEDLFQEVAQKSKVPLVQAKRLAALLFSKHRLHLLTELSDAFQACYWADFKIEPVIIHTAQVLSKEMQERLERELKKRIGENIICRFEVRTELISGIRIQKRDAVWDATLLAKLEILTQRLMS